ncbi:MAG: fibronectin type III domain-containing protein [Acidobacteria bacterium]|nr:fibronectin type III domain-containing protein [Acidobacteriota bacterium]
MRIPAAPEGFSAERRANIVDLTFTVPATNTDGTRPANIERIDIFAFTGAATVTDQVVLSSGTRIASLLVKFPRDPNAVVEPDDTDDGLEPLVGTGLDQGVTTHVREEVSNFPPAVAPSPGAGPAVRSYIGVGISTSGRRGLLSKRAVVPLRAPPDPPSSPQLTYDERAITVTWTASPGQPQTDSAMAYHVYEVAPAAAISNEARRMTSTPIEATQFLDARVEWGVARCYAVRSVDVRDGMVAESDASPSSCLTVVDRFAPRAPEGLTAVASDAAVNLVWDANTEADLAGYLIARGIDGSDELVRMTPAPVTETTFRDAVAPGVRYRYSVAAVDTSGNVSVSSAPVNATAR